MKPASIISLRPFRLSGSLLLAASLALATAAAEEAPGFSFKANEKFVYKLTVGGDSGAQQVKTSQGPTAYVAGIPDKETVLIKSVEACPGGRCYFVQIDQEVPPFLPEQKEGPYQEQITASFNAETGEIKSFASKLTVGQSVSTSVQTSFDRSATVGEFFGPWMLDLKDGYKQTFKRSNGERTFQVVKREKVGGRDCFVVLRTQTVTGGAPSQTTYWVDARRRFAVQVKADNGRTLALVE